MLQSIRDNSQGIIAKIIVGLIAVTFALFGVESLVSLTAASNAPATVNGVEISQQELHQGVQLQRRQMLAQMGDDADPTLLDDNLISNMVLEGLIEQSILVQSAEEQGLVFSDGMIDQMIVSTKDFQLDGKFDRDQFQSVLRNAGLTPLLYRDLVRKEKITEQERIAFALSAFTLQSEVESIASLDGQTRDIRFFNLPADSIRDSLTISDEQIQEYFDANADQYMTEEQVSIEYLLLERDKLQQGMQVSADDLQAAYQSMVDNYQAQEQRHAAHILIEISDAQDDAAAKAKIDALAEKIKNGEDFAALAQAESDDPVSAEMGGDLGVNEKGVFSSEFEDALYNLQKGEVSAPVRTEFGYHLIKLLDTISSEAPSFAEAEEELRADLLKQKAEEEYVAQLEQLADISFSAGDLVEPSEALDLEIQNTGPFSRSGSDDEISSNAKVLAVAFDAELIKEGLNSTPIELDSGRAMVLRVADHQLPRAKSIDEVADQIKALLVEQETAKAMQAEADKIIAELKQGGSLASVAAINAITEQKALTRNQQEIAQEIRVAAFKMPKPAESTSSFTAVSMLDGSQTILVLDAVSQEKAELEAEELRLMSMVLNNRAGQQDYQDHLEQLKKKAEIERL